MAIVNPEELKTRFESGDKPTEQDYIDLIDTLGAYPQQLGGIPGLKWTGDWASGVQYKQRDAVQFNGSSYYCLKDHTSTPSEDPALDPSDNWDILALKGQAGAGGIQEIADYATLKNFLMNGSQESAFLSQDIVIPSAEVININGDKRLYGWTLVI